MIFLVSLLLSPSQMGPAMTRMSAARTRGNSAGHSSIVPAVFAHVRVHTGGDVVIDRAELVDRDAAVSP